MTQDAEKTLAWEARHRLRGAIAALVGSLGLLVFYVAGQVMVSGEPLVSGLEALGRVGQSPDIGALPSLQTERFEYLDSRAGVAILIGLGGFAGFVGTAWAASFLGVATRGRRPEMRRFVIYLPIVGGVVIGVAALMSQFGNVVVVNDFLDSGRTVDDAIDANSSQLLLWASLLFQLGSYVLAVGLVMISLNAMRVGLLTRMLGYLGIAAGAMLVIVPLPIVQIFWIGALGFLLLGRWPGGDPPAWRTGQAEPWPVPERQQRPPRKSSQSAPSLTKSSAPAGARRKRKKRN